MTDSNFGNRNCTMVRELTEYMQEEREKGWLDICQDPMPGFYECAHLQREDMH